MQENRPLLPPADRIGVLIAAVLLAFALTRLIQTPRFTITLSLPGFYFAFPLTFGVFMTILAAALAAAGMHWLTQKDTDHGWRVSAEHLLLPAITTFVIGASLALLPDGLAWWAGFAFGGVLLTAVFLAELITAVPFAPNYALARAGLTALAYALFLILVASLRFAGARMFLLVPALFLFAGLISLRILHLDGTDRWDFPWAIGIGLVCAQIGGGLHYWTLAPLPFGLALTGPLYALTTLAMSLSANVPLQRAAIFPLVILLSAWTAAALL